MSTNNRRRAYRNRNGARGKAPRATGNQGASGVFSEGSSNVGMTIRSLPLFPYRTRRNLQYRAAGSLITGTATANAYVFSANGIFDPDITGTGGQPMGFDQMMVFYNHYTVLRSRITVLAANTSASLMPNFGLLVSGSSVVTSSIETMLENGDITYHWLNYAGARGGDARLVRAVDAAKFQGIDDIMDDPNMRGDSASNPTEQLYYHLVTWNDTSSVQVTSNWQAFIQYDVMFHEPRKGSLSSKKQSEVVEHKDAGPCAEGSHGSTSVPVGKKWVLVDSA